MARVAVPAIAASVVASACGGSPALTATAAPADAPHLASPVAAEAPSTNGSDDKGKAKAEGLPTACAPGGEPKLCTPPREFVKRLCGGYFPDVALVLFAKGSPWTRGYLSRNVEAWNASGGASSRDKLEFDEEVLVLHHKVADTGGMQVSGSGGGYDVLRWDGTCASLASEELRLKVPPSAKNARLNWKALDLKTREALLAEEKIGKADDERRKECKGATMGEVSVKCLKADTRLGVVVVDFVRKGGAVPPPEKLP